MKPLPMLLHKKPTPERSRFPIEQKRREHVREALVKEIGLNNEVESPEQRGMLSVEEKSVIRPIFRLSYTDLGF